MFLTAARSGTPRAVDRPPKIGDRTVSRRLQALEAATGQDLFQRTADGNVLTEGGHPSRPHVLAHGGSRPGRGTASGRRRAKTGR
ncbi:MULTISPECIES: helix-turn-helix domain-containing protein [Rhizobium/Agrobacterium group]|uniref:helix-turn-helix domain-containing protein n=1 Tax=Rhizobium/Agrobacterium group TaxID=227290 RepID=UPI0019109A4F